MRTFMLVMFWIQLVSMLIVAGKAFSYRGTKSDVVAALVGVVLVVWGARVLGWV